MDAAPEEDRGALLPPTEARSRTLLSVETGHEQPATEDERPLEQRLLQLVRNSPDRIIRPARVAAELGMSVEDGCAELCGLLAAVGKGASFWFEAPNANEQHAAHYQRTMVFSFPPDFESRARHYQRKQDMWDLLQKIGWIMVKFLKIVTAFGLIISLLILAVAAMLALVAAIIALSRDNSGHRHRGALLRQVRLLFFSVRELLWCYALFGPSGDRDEYGQQQQDPFLREVAYDLWLTFSVCCGHPGSIFYWIRMNQLSRRRNRLFRGFARSRPRTHNLGWEESDIPGVFLVQRGDHQDPSPGMGLGESTNSQGLLSIAVEFLFGPSPFAPGPTETDKWKLRAASLVKLSATTEPAGSGVSLEALGPYVDDPPKSCDGSNKIVEQALLIVSHFNGIPTAESSVDKQTTLATAKFVYPELMAESSVASQYEYVESQDDGTWASLLYTEAENQTPRRCNSLPTFLKEERYRFTKLTSQQLMHCVVLGSLNLIGVIWFRQSISKGGVMEVPLGTSFAKFLFHGLLPVLTFYSRLFFALPIGRLLLILMWNRFRRERNQRRAALVRRTLGTP